MSDESERGVQPEFGHITVNMTMEESQSFIKRPVSPALELARGYESLRRRSTCRPREFVGQEGDGKKIIERTPEILPTLDRLVKPFIRGDPESSLRWVSKSTRHLRDALKKPGYSISQPQVGKLLDMLGYSLQAPKKTEEGKTHPDRDAQFHHVALQVHAFLLHGWPVISVDAKKKEKIGNYANTGQEYYKRGQPPQAKVYDFVDKTLGKVTPYGMYDLGRNTGFVNVGVSADTAEFAVNSIRKWWNQVGQDIYRHARALLILADGGGSNSSRGRLWKVKLQQLATELRMPIYVCHYPPGTSKWNPIEHRLFAHITQNWRGKLLTSRETVVALIRHTTTQQGLTVQARLDEQVYEKGRKIRDDELTAIKMTRAVFHGEWNYFIYPTLSF